MKYKFHKLCNAFPEMGEEEFNELCLSIEISGQREPIVLFGNEILDGKHRYKACDKLGIRPTFRHFDIRKDGMSLVQFVWDRNQTRRNMTPSERAAVAVTLELERAKDDEEGKVGRMSTLETLSRRAGVSRRTMSRAKRLAQQDPTDLQLVAEGKKSLTESRTLDPKATQHREMLADQMAIIHGDKFATGVRVGDLLPGSHLAEFAAMTEADQRASKMLVSEGWKPSLARKFARGEFLDSDTVRDIINYADYAGGSASVHVSGYRIEIFEEL